MTHSVSCPRCGGDLLVLVEGQRNSPADQSPGAVLVLSLQRVNGLDQQVFGPIQQRPAERCERAPGRQLGSTKRTIGLLAQVPRDDVLDVSGIGLHRRDVTGADQHEGRHGSYRSSYRACWGQHPTDSDMTRDMAHEMSRG